MATSTIKKSLVRTAALQVVTVNDPDAKAYIATQVLKVAAVGRFVEVGTLVTPELAAALLETNIENRKISDEMVARYARDMHEGRWVHNAESLKIDADGNMIDGQHRCYSAFTYGLTFRTDIAFGVPRKARLTMDQGKKRGASDLIQMDSELVVGRPKILAGAIRILLELDGINSRPSSVEVVKAVEQYPGLNDHQKVANKVYQTLRVPSPSQCLALAWKFAQLSQEDADRFWDQLISGLDLAEDNPVYKLRQRLIAISGSAKLRSAERAAMALVIKGWNAFRKGKQVKGTLRWRQSPSETEAFPVPE